MCVRESNFKSLYIGICTNNNYYYTIYKSLDVIKRNIMPKLKIEDNH